MADLLQEEGWGGAKVTKPVVQCSVDGTVRAKPIRSGSIHPPTPPPAPLFFPLSSPFSVHCRSKPGPRRGSCGGTWHRCPASLAHLHPASAPSPQSVTLPVPWCDGGKRDLAPLPGYLGPSLLGHGPIASTGPTSCGTNHVKRRSSSTVISSCSNAREVDVGAY